MSLYVIADLHLSTNEKTNKSMEKFGARWQGYTEKLRKNWCAIINDDDTVIIPGDISWAMTLDEAKEDFLFLDSLPGKKIIGKGNHDFWWATASKIHTFFEENNIKTISLLHNNAYLLDDCIVCGSRGWFYDEKQQNTVGEVDYSKIIAREVQRLEISLSEAEKIKKEKANDLPVLVFLHFPPVFGDFVCEEIIEVLKKHSVENCFYGHIHGSYSLPRTFEYDGISFTICSADYLSFAPMPIFI